MHDWSSNRENFWQNMPKQYYQKNTKRVPRTLVANFVKDNDVLSVLELGCNTGGNLLSIYRKTPEVRLTGIDICAKAIRYGKLSEKNPAQLLVGSIYDLSMFADDSFDLVFTRGVLLHINNEQTPAIVAEMKRISSKYILNIETHGEPQVRSSSKGVPHSFSHDFDKIYRELGLEPNITTTTEMTERVHKGGDDHFVWATLKGSE